MSNETVDNQTTPVEGQVAEADNQDAGQAQTDASNDTATKGETEAQPAFDVQTSYKALEDKYSKLNDSYGEIRGAFTRSTQEAAELRRQIESLGQMLAKATETPINPEQFFKDLQTQGPKALDVYLDKKLGTVNKAYEEQVVKNVVLEANFEKYRREMDNDNYPNFKELETTMQEIAESPNCPVDLSRPIPEVYDALYKLARDQHSTDALKQAQEMGRKQAEAELAKESATTVAGGGKASSAANPREIKDLAKLRQYFVERLGESAE